MLITCTLVFCPVSAIPPDFPQHLSLELADTPLIVEKVCFWLDQYPLIPQRYILRQGISTGFHLYTRVHHNSVHFPNHGSARRNPQVVWRKLAKEVGAGRMAGPFPSPPDLPFHRICPLGLVDKDEGTDYRMIHDLSAQDEWGQSVNNMTPDCYRKVQYSSFEISVNPSHCHSFRHFVLVWSRFVFLHLKLSSLEQHLLLVFVDYFGWGSYRRIPWINGVILFFLRM